MSTIAIAGAGVGGLVAAWKLALAGHDVTVYERCREEDCAHEQKDSFDATAMDYAGIDIPNGYIAPGNDITFYPLDESMLYGLLDRYGRDVTCVCFMGGDREPDEVMRLARLVHKEGLKTAWYSGRQELPKCFDIGALDYVKVGPYIESKGPLTSPDTNQQMYRIESGQMIDITNVFTKKGVS